MAGNAFFMRIFATLATRAPVHAPVPGRGIATRINSPHISYLPSELHFLSARSSRRSTTGPRRGIFFIQSKIFRMNKSMNGIGNILPIKPIPKAYSQLRSYARAAISAPRISDTGMIDSSATTISGVKNCSKNDLIASCTGYLLKLSRIVYYIYARVKVLKYFLVGISKSRVAVCTDLTHSDAVTPSANSKGKFMLCAVVRYCERG